MRLVGARSRAAVAVAHGHVERPLGPGDRQRERDGERRVARPRLRGAGGGQGRRGDVVLVARGDEDGGQDQGSGGHERPCGGEAAAHSILRDPTIIRSAGRPFRDGSTLIVVASSWDAPGAQRHRVVERVGRLDAQHPRPLVVAEVGHRLRLRDPRVPDDGGRGARALDPDAPAPGGVLDRDRAGVAAEDAVGLAGDRQRRVAERLHGAGVRLVDVARPLEAGDPQLPGVADGEIAVQRLGEAEGLVALVAHGERQSQVAACATTRRAENTCGKKRCVYSSERSSSVAARAPSAALLDRHERPLGEPREAVQRRGGVVRLRPEPREADRHAAPDRLAGRELALP